VSHFRNNLKKIFAFSVTAGFSLRPIFSIISQAKACGYILKKPILLEFLFLN